MSNIKEGFELEVGMQDKDEWILEATSVGARYRVIEQKTQLTGLMNSIVSMTIPFHVTSKVTTSSS
jgi:hypothetical protein